MISPSPAWIRPLLSIPVWLSFQEDHIESHGQTGYRHSNVEPRPNYCSWGDRRWIRKLRKLQVNCKYTEQGNHSKLCKQMCIKEVGAAKHEKIYPKMTKMMWSVNIWSVSRFQLFTEQITTLEIGKFWFLLLMGFYSKCLSLHKPSQWTFILIIVNWEEQRYYNPVKCK